MWQKPNCWEATCARLITSQNSWILRTHIYSSRSCTTIIHSITSLFVRIRPRVLRVLGHRLHGLLLFHGTEMAICTRDWIALVLCLSRFMKSGVEAKFVLVRYIFTLKPRKLACRPPKRFNMRVRLGPNLKVKAQAWRTMTTHPRFDTQNVLYIDDLPNTVFSRLLQSVY